MIQKILQKRKNLLRNNHISLSFKSIAGSLAIGIGLFLVLLAALGWYSYSASSFIGAKAGRLVNVKVPSALNIRSIHTQVLKSAAYQQAYHISGENKWVSQRKAAWENKIFPAMQEVLAASPRFEKKELQVLADSLDDMLKAQALAQEELDNLLSAYFNKPTDENLDAVAKQNQANKEQLHRIEQNLKEFESGMEPTITRDIGKNFQKVERYRQNILIGFVVLFLVALASVVWVISRLVKALRKPRHVIQELAQGKVQEDITPDGNELDSVLEATAALSRNMSSASEFAHAIGEGNLERQFQPASESDELGNSLLQMRDKLKQVAEKDAEESWIEDGVNRVGELLRQYQNDFDQLTDRLIAEVVEYLNAQQGAVFTVARGNEEGEQEYLEMAASYAFHRKKYNQKTFEPGQGLVGQAYEEHNSLLINEVPEDYMRINSGLGEIDPSSLLITPLLVNERAEGVFEVASVEEFTPKQKEYLERVANITASTFANVKANERTRKLLEESQMQAEQMKAQEEEMRQNMEELSATQEEMERKEKELQKMYEESKQNEEELKSTEEQLRKSMMDVMRANKESQAQAKRLQAVLDSAIDPILTIDEEGAIESINQATLKKFGFQQKAEVQGLSVNDLFPRQITGPEGFVANFIWGKNSLLGRTAELSCITQSGEIFPVEASVNETEIPDQKLYNVFLRDITDRVEAEAEIKEQNQQLSQQKEELHQNMEELKSANEQMHRQEEQIMKTVKDLKSKNQQLADKEQQVEEALEKANSEKNLVGAILETNPEPILAIDNAGTIRLANENAQALFGYDQESLLGSPFSTLVPAAANEEAASFLERHRATGEELSPEKAHQFTAQHESGIQFTIELSLFQFELEGQPMFAGFIRDKS